MLRRIFVYQSALKCISVNNEMTLGLSISFVKI